MKKILITGANSFIGTSFENYIKENCPDEYTLDTIDMTNGAWREKSFTGYDAVFHVAGIAHQKETLKNANLYYEVNRDLTVETAKKAKLEGVSQFIFLSSMSVYGLDTGVITKDTPTCPKNNYGKSKLQAEKELIALSSDGFLVCILRPPMVYAKGCPGNYGALEKISRLSPILPDFKNRRSVISINNLIQTVKECVDSKKRGVLCPQDEDFLCTADEIIRLRQTLGKPFIKTKAFNPLIKILIKHSKKARKAFGDLVYHNFDNIER